MARSFSRKKRNTATRRQKPLILIIAEGQNVTESQYFRHFQEQHADYNIKILIPGCILRTLTDTFAEQNGRGAESADASLTTLG